MLADFSSCIQYVPLMRSKANVTSIKFVFESRFNGVEARKSQHMCVTFVGSNCLTSSACAARTCLFNDQEAGNEKEALSSGGPFQTFL